MTGSNFFSRPAIYCAVAVYIACTYLTLAMGHSFIAATIPEDHYFELAGAFSLFVTSLLFLYGFRLARRSLDKSWTSLAKQFIYLAVALLFFFGAGEEISWGQRIFGFETPETLARVNKQDELNLHNLSVLENSDLFTADRMFDAFWFLFAVLTPAAASILPSFRRFAGKFVPIVHWGMSLLFLYNFFWAKLAKIAYTASYSFDRISLAQAIQEIKESNYAVIFVLVGLYAVWDLSRSKDEGSIPVKGGAANREPAFRH